MDWLPIVHIVKCICFLRRSVQNCSRCRGKTSLIDYFGEGELLQEVLLINTD